MDLNHYLPVIAGMAVVAFLYASVGHGGASGYLAVMALAGFLPEVMKPTALTLNLATSSMAAVMFWRAGHFSARLFIPVAVTSIPLAYLGGRWTAPSVLFHWLVALSLVSAALGLVVRLNPPDESPKDPSLITCLITGGGIGFLSGLVGVGGGIFLTPIMLLAGWCRPKTASAVSALFIFVNSVSGLLGNSHSVSKIPSAFPWFLVAVMIAGALGAFWGSGVATNLRIRKSLAVVLVLAAVKMVITV
jgi:uncharacterized membrane protein YfcA